MRSRPASPPADLRPSALGARALAPSPRRMWGARGRAATKLTTPFRSPGRTRTAPLRQALSPASPPLKQAQHRKASSPPASKCASAARSNRPPARRKGTDGLLASLVQSPPPVSSARPHLYYLPLVCVLPPYACTSFATTLAFSKRNLQRRSMPRATLTSLFLPPAGVPLARESQSVPTAPELYLPDGSASSLTRRRFLASTASTLLDSLSLALDALSGRSHAHRQPPHRFRRHRATERSPLLLDLPHRTRTTRSPRTRRWSASRLGNR